jgi:signal transduction histidine kinase
MSKRALVVDNDRLCVQLLRDILQSEGYVVATALDGMEALEVLRAELPDLVFLDLVMPQIDGEHILRYLRGSARTARIPVVIVSGALVEDPSVILGLSANAYVAKGPGPELERNIRTALRRLADGTLAAPGEILGLEGLVPRHKVRELLDLRRYVASLLCAIAEGVVEVNAHRRVLAANEAALAILGRPVLELIGSPLAELLGPEHREALASATARFLDGCEGTPARVTLTVRERVLELGFAWIAPADPGTGCFVLLRDVTDLKRKLEDLSGMNERLLVMDRMRAELFTMVSHDLHTPITAIKGSLEVLLNEDIGAELSRELLGIAQKNADRLFRMVGDILDLARIEAGRYRGRREPFEVVACLRGAVDRLQHLAYERGIAMMLEAPEAVPPIQADGVRLEQVFTNLLSNALKYTPRMGRIDVVVEEREAELLVQVRDTGVGIAQEHLDRIFDRFFRVPVAPGTEVDGTGLGLSICKAVVEEHGGRIWAESQLGKGTTFFVAVPRKAQGEGGEQKI